MLRQFCEFFIVPGRPGKTTPRCDSFNSQNSIVMNSARRTIRGKIFVASHPSHNVEKHGSNWLESALIGRGRPIPVHFSSEPNGCSRTHELESLQLDVRRLQLEHDLLMRANELIKKETGINRQVLTNREKTLLADALRHR